MEGYAKLSQLMGQDRTDGHYLIFQKFEQLSVQNLLYHQAEIVNLQEALNHYAKENGESEDPDKKLYARDWDALGNPGDNEQWATWLQLRKQLKEYYKAIYRHQMVSNLPPPHKGDLKFLQEWLERPSMGNCSFIGADRHIYNSDAGLVTLSSTSRDIDPLTRYLLYKLPQVYHDIVVALCHRLFGRWVKKPEISHSGSTNQNQSNDWPLTDLLETTTQAELSEETHTGSSRSEGSITQVATTTTSNEIDQNPENGKFDIEANIFLYRDSYFQLIANTLGTLISSLIPIAAIVALYFVTNMSLRLAMVCVFTAFFSVALSLVTSATRVEIFTATAAFASVQVVFVGSTQAF